MVDTMGVLALVSIIAVGNIYIFFSHTWWGVIAAVPFIFIIIIWLLGFLSDIA